MVSIIRTALITRVKIPKVKIFIGKVKMISKGFKKVLITPKTKAITKAEKKS